MSIIEGVLFLYLSFSVLYSLLLAIAGLLYRPKSPPTSPKIHRIAVLIPCYKEDFVILSVAERMLRFNYPKDSYDVVIIADSFKPETLKQLSTMPLTLLPVNFERSLKSKSLNHALNNLPKQYDIALVLDGDNVTGPNFLHQINDAYSAGYRVVQAQRVAKNMDTPFAILDAASEAISNHMFRKGANGLGLSACFIGSGIAMDFGLMRQKMAGIESVFEDRELQLALAKDRIKIKYLNGAFVYDEKVDDPEAFRRQRRRWFYAQVQSVGVTFFPGIAQLFRGNFDYFNFGVIYNVVLPRVFNIILILSLAAIGFVVHYPDLTAALAWVGLLGVYALSLFISVPRSFYNLNTLRAIAHIPFVMLKSVQAIFEMNKSRKGFIHTQHTRTEVSNTVFRDENQ